MELESIFDVDIDSVLRVIFMQRHGSALKEDGRRDERETGTSVRACS